MTAQDIERIHEAYRFALQRAEAERRRCLEAFRERCAATLEAVRDREAQRRHGLDDYAWNAYTDAAAVIRAVPFEEA